VSEKLTEFGSWSLKDIVTGRYFRVPNYQRGYAWGTRQLEEFWEDLYAVMESKGKHYTGAITVESIPLAKESISRKGFEVVDGQQRLTTMAILLSILNLEQNPFEYKENGGIEYVFSYGEGNEDLGFLRGVLSGVELESPENCHQRNLKNAQAFFNAKISNLDDCKKKCLANTLMSSLTFDFRILSRAYNSGVVFETMNNRGKPLTLLEKLKNRLMYLVNAQITPDNEDDMDMFEADKDYLLADINTAWGNIYRALACNPNDEPLDEDEFVAAHLSVYRNPKERVYSEAVAESRLFKMFCVHSNVYPKSESIDDHDERALERAIKEEEISFDKIRDYVEDLKNFSGPWAKIHSEFETSVGRCRLISGTREVKVFLATVLLHVNDETLRESIFKTAERILFRNTIKTVLDEGSFVVLARRLHGKCLDMLRGHESVVAKAEDILEIMNAAVSDERHQIDIEKLVDRFAEGFYGWSGLKYFLFNEEGETGLPWSKFEEVSVEHIIPQSSVREDDGWWARQVREFAPYEGQWRDLGREDRRKCRQRRHALVNSLGNFVLLTQSENASVSDDPWEGYPAVEGSHGAVVGKKSFYADPSRTSSAGAREVAENIDCWNSFRVRERGRALFRKLIDMLADGPVSISDEDVDMALGFGGILNLQDTVFCALSEKEVNELAPRLGTGAGHRVRRRNAQANNGHRPNAMNEDQRNVVLESLREKGIPNVTRDSYVPYANRSADFMLFSGNVGNLYLKEESADVGFYGIEYATMRVWVNEQLRECIKGNDIFNGWNLSVGDSTPKGQSAVWFTLRKNSPVRRGPGSWYGERNEVIQVAVALYAILRERGVFAVDKVLLLR
jgi:hypothetical protein